MPSVVIVIEIDECDDIELTDEIDDVDYVDENDEMQTVEDMIYEYIPNV